MSLWVNSLDQTSDGGFALAGASDSGIWLLKFDSDANLQWQKAYDGNGQWARSIRQTSDGGYIVGGFTRSDQGNSTYNGLILKVDSSGNPQWQKRFLTGLEGLSDESDAGKPNSILQSSDGGYVVASKAYSLGNSYLLVLKLDQDGNAQWQKSYGGRGYNWGHSIQQTSDGGYIVAGITDSFGAGGGDIWIVKLGMDGNMQWQKTYGGPGFDEANSIQQTSDGGYIVAGRTFSFGGCSGAWVLKLTEDGTAVWQKTYGLKDFGDVSLSANSVQQTSDGGYIIAAETREPTAFGLAFNFDIWILKLNDNGSLAWQKSPVLKKPDPDPKQNRISSVQQTPDGGYVMVGWTSIIGAGDILLMKLNSQGDNPGCLITETSDVVVTDTHVTGKDASIAGGDTDIVLPMTNATSKDTGITERVVCVASSFIIVLTTPSNNLSVSSCSKGYGFSPPTFSWDAGETFSGYELQFSPDPSFILIPLAFETESSSTQITFTQATWEEIMMIPETSGGTVYWRVVGTRPDGSTETSETRSFGVQGTGPVGNPNISPTGKRSKPTLTWQTNCSTRLKVWFGSVTNFNKKTSYSFEIANPSDLKTLTPGQWMRIKMLVKNKTGSTIYWYIESWDALGRYAKTEVMSFVLTDQSGGQEDEHKKARCAYGFLHRDSYHLGSHG